MRIGTSAIKVCSRMPTPGRRFGTISLRFAGWKFRATHKSAASRWDKRAKVNAPRHSQCDPRAKLIQAKGQPLLAIVGLLLRGLSVQLCTWRQGVTPSTGRLCKAKFSLVRGVRRDAIGVGRVEQDSGRYTLGSRMKTRVVTPKQVEPNTGVIGSDERYPRLFPTACISRASLRSHRPFSGALMT